MITENDIDRRMTPFYQKARDSAPVIPPPKPFVATITEAQTDSVPFSSPTELPTKIEEEPSALAPPKPKPTNITPDRGPIRGGQSVTITGTDFVDGATVLFGETKATSIVIVDSTKITCIAPAHSQGAVTIKVQNIPDKTEFEGTLNLAYTYVAPPTITLVNPAFGPTAGGTIVTISGNNLAYVTSVNWGGANIPFVSGSELRVTAPPHSAGFINITVSNDFGDTGSRANAFKYLAPPDSYQWFTAIGHTPSDTGFDNGGVKRFQIAAFSGGVFNSDYQGHINISTIFIGPAVSFNDSPDIDYPIPVVNGIANFDVQAFCIDHGGSTVQSLQFHAQDIQYAVGADSPLYGVANTPDLAVGGRRTGGGGGGGVNVIGWVMGYADAFSAHGKTIMGPWNWEGVTLRSREVKIQLKNASGFVVDYNGPGTLDHVYITPSGGFNGLFVSHFPTINFVHGEATTVVSATYSGDNPAYQSSAYFYLKASANGANGQSPQCVILNHL